MTQSRGELEEKIFKIKVKYISGHKMNSGLGRCVSGHKVMAKNEIDALRIANKYNISNPMGSKDTIERYIDVNCTRYLNSFNNVCGNFWLEEKGELIRKVVDNKRRKP